MLFGRQQIWGDILPSLGEMYLGLAIALAGGLVIGILLGSSRTFAAITTPYLVFLNATPLVITLPLLTVWVGTTLKARIVFISLLAIWPVLNVAAGCRNISGRYRELGRALGLSRSRRECPACPHAVARSVDGRGQTARLTVARSRSTLQNKTVAKSQSGDSPCSADGLNGWSSRST